MAITMRKGLYADFNPMKMLPGEWAVTIDADTQHQVVYMCFGAGIVKRMGTLEDFEAWLTSAMIPYTTEFDRIYNECNDMRTEIVYIYDTLIPLTDIVEHIPEFAFECQQSVEDCNNIKEAIEDAIEINTPHFDVDFETGQLIYTGGQFLFNVNENSGQLEWLIA